MTKITRPLQADKYCHHQGTNGNQILAWTKSENKQTKNPTLGKYGGKGKGSASFKALNCPMLWCNTMQYYTVS